MRKNSKKNIFPAFLAGVLNGVLGTGGGVPLWFAANKKEDKKAAFATSSTGVLLLSAVTLFSYRQNAPVLTGPSALFLWFALAGGALGAYLLTKIPLGAVRLLFAFLLIGSGVFALGKTAYDLFFA